MPLAGTGDALGDLIRESVDALSDEEKSDRDALFKAMGNAIIAHLIANGTGAVLTAGAAAGAVALPGNLQ